MSILEDLNFIIDQKKKVEDNLELAHEKRRKMEESILMKNVEEDENRR
jgi:hypothetical protein